ncbi:unnamed protein product, partial [Arabidopsis halleri]
KSICLVSSDSICPIKSENRELMSPQVEKEEWLDGYRRLSVFEKMLLLSILNAKDGGFLVNNEVKIVVEVDVLQVIGKLDVSKESQEVTQPLKRMRLNGGAVSSHLHNETSSVDVNGFLVLPSQAESLKRIFEKHPEMAQNFRVKN